MDALLNSTTFWVGLSFVIFVALVFRIAQKALHQWLDSKIAKIQSDLAEAAQLRHEAEALLKTAKDRHAKATVDAEHILKQAHTQAQTAAAVLEADTQKQLARREQLALERIALAERQAMVDIQQKTIAASMELARSVLATELTQAQKDQLLTTTIGDISKAA